MTTATSKSLLRIARLTIASPNEARESSKLIWTTAALLAIALITMLARSWQTARDQPRDFSSMPAASARP